MDFSEFPFLCFLCPRLTIKSVCLSVVFFCGIYALSLGKREGSDSQGDSLEGKGKYCTTANIIHN
jgi:hypothetical protein